MSVKLSASGMFAMGRSMQEIFIENNLQVGFNSLAIRCLQTGDHIACHPNIKEVAAVLKTMNDPELSNKIKNRYEWILIDSIPFLKTDILLGRGSYGTVYQGVSPHGQLCALKNGVISDFERFVLVQAKEGVKGSEASCINWMFAGSKRHLALELGESNLKTYLEGFLFDPGDLTECELEDIAIFNRNILSALCEIKQHGVVHFDIKDENLIVFLRDDYRCLKLADFGLSMSSKASWNGQGSPQFYSPEQFNAAVSKGLEINFKHQCDIWSAMLVLIQINQQCMSKPFADRARAFNQKVNELVEEIEGQHDQVKKFSKAMLEYFDSEFDKGMNGIFDGLKPTSAIEAIIQQMAKFDPTDRMTAEDALSLFDGYIRPLPNEQSDLDKNFAIEFLAETEIDMVPEDDIKDSPATLAVSDLEDDEGDRQLSISDQFASIELNSVYE